MNETQKITQPLWSKITYKGEDTLMFYLPELTSGEVNEAFGMYIGFFNSCSFDIRELVFFVDGKETSHRFLDHMMKYAYFTLRVVDRDFLMLPCFCMERKERTLSVKLSIPIRIGSYINTCVYLHFSKKFKGNVDIMCSYMGEYERKSI